jgi:predicted PurR-regulated permease PerM
MAEAATPESEGSVAAHEASGVEPGAPAPTIRLPETRRGLALTILATLGVVFALEWAQGFVIAVLVGILFAYTLNPLVVWLERARIPRVAGTTLVMLGVVCVFVLGSYSLRGQVRAILDRLPEAVSEVSTAITAIREGQTSTMQKVQTAASAIEKATRPEPGAASAPKQRETRIVVDAPGLKVGGFLWSSGMGAVDLFGRAVMVLILTFFLLLSGDTYKRKLVRITGPSLSKRKITVRVLDEINESIQRYLFMLLVTNVLVGLLTWVVLRWIGLENDGAWATAAGLLHVIPYIGPAATAAGVGLAAFLQFKDMSTALLVAGASLAIATLVGMFVTTWMTGRIAKMNKAAVFVSVLFWGWLWGVWGMLLSIPITVIVKVVAQRVEELEQVAELLGD